MHKSFVAGLAAFGLMATAANAAYTWNSVQIWGGGYVPGVTFTATGDAYLRTDVGGAYKLNSDDSWTPLNDAFTNPDDMGSVAIAVDSENENYVYSTAGLYMASWSSSASLLRSSDGGSTWTKLPIELNGTKLYLAGNGEGRGMGNRLAIKGTTVLLGTNQNGLIKSTDRGATWSKVGSFATGVSAVFLDKSGNVYAAPYEGGLYKSINSGSTWSKVSDISGVMYQAAISGNIAWLTTNTSKTTDQNGVGGGAVYMYDISNNVVKKANINSSCGFLGVATTNNGRNAVVSTGGCWSGNGGLFDNNFVPHESIFYTQNSGSSWNEILKKGTFDKASAPGSANNNPHWLSGLGLNPTNPDHIIFGTGYGIWSTKNATAASPTWTFNDKGIEETVPLSIVSSSYGAPLVTALGDIDGSYHVDLDSPKNPRHVKNEGTNYVVDYAGQVPNKMIRIHKQATDGLGSYSTDGGKSWTNFSSHPNYVVSGTNYSNESNFAAISAKGTSIVWNMDNFGVFYSKNNGSTWSAASGISDVSGFRVVADKFTDGTFYLYSPKAGELYKTTDHGATWSAVNSKMATLADYAYGYGKAFASPKAAGDIWVTQGTNSFGIWTNTNADGVYRSTNGGTSFSKVNGLAFATNIGFGVGKNGGTAVYAVGIANSDTQIGIYRSDDDGATWTKINGDKGFGGVTMITGDPCVYSRVYVGTNGRGVLYGEEPGSKNTTCKDRTDFADGSSSSSVASSSSSAPALSSSSVAPVVSSSSTGTDPNTCKALTTECYSEAELCAMGISFFCNTEESSSSIVSEISSSSSMEPQSSSSDIQIDPPTCDALIPECGYTPEKLCTMGIVEYCASITDPTDPAKITGSQAAAKTSLSRQGNMLIAQGTRASIRLFDMNGNLIREVSALSSKVSMSLAGLRKGTYIAKSGNQTVKVNVK